MLEKYGRWQIKEIALLNSQLQNGNTNIQCQNLIFKILSKIHNNNNNNNTTQNCYIHFAIG